MNSKVTNNEIVGRISSVQTLGSLDGPGLRYVAFLQGCPLKCAYCHNIETRDFIGGTQTTASALIADAQKYREYFGKRGGITLSGGEPLVQAEFVTEVFKKAKADGINTCLDTSGAVLNEQVEELLAFTDYCLLDIKFTSDEEYLKYTGLSYRAALDFLEALTRKNVPTRIRQVIVEGLNDTENNVLKLKELKNAHPNVEEIELLPMRKLCIFKYRDLGLRFPLDDYPETSQKTIDRLNALLKSEN